MGVGRIKFSARVSMKLIDAVSMELSSKLSGEGLAK